MEVSRCFTVGLKIKEWGCELRDSGTFKIWETKNPVFLVVSGMLPDTSISGW